MKYKWCILLLSIILSQGLFAQSNSDPELITDRPDQTESAAVVPAKHLQIESGFVFEKDKSNEGSSTGLDLFTTLLRYGINEHFELRLGTSYMESGFEPKDGDKSTVSGMAPLNAGIKFKMLQEKGVLPEMAFLLTTTLPNSGKDDFSPEYLATEMRFAIEYTLCDRLGLGVNLGSAWDGENAQPAGIYSLVLGADVMQNTGFFLEAYGELPQNRLPDHRMDAGFTYLLKDNLQLDASGGIGLSDISPDFFISAGISWRIPN